MMVQHGNPVGDEIHAGLSHLLRLEPEWVWPGSVVRKQDDPVVGGCE